MHRPPFSSLLLTAVAVAILPVALQLISPQIGHAQAPTRPVKARSTRGLSPAKVETAPLPRQATEGTVPAPPDFDTTAETRERTKQAGPAVAKKRQIEIKTLRGKLARTPTAPGVARWLHSLAQLEHAEAHWQQALANLDRAKAEKAVAKEKRLIEKKLRRHRRKVATAIRRHWGLPKPPDTTIRTVVPPRVSVNLLKSIQDYESIITNHPRYRRMDDVLLNAGGLRIEHGLEHNNIPSIATGEQYLNQVLHEFGWSPLATRARVRLADLALSRRNLTKAKDYLKDLAANEDVPVVRDYARLRLARLLASTNLAKSVIALERVARETPDATLRRIASSQAAKLRSLLPPPRVEPKSRAQARRRHKRRARRRRRKP